MTTFPTIPLAASRALALYAQHLHRPPTGSVTADTIYDLVERVGWVQIDTLHMVARSHYLVLWSRLGQYDPAVFDALVYAPEQRRLFEYWKKAACIIPLQTYPYSRARMEAAQKHLRKGWSEWLKKAENQRVLEQVRERIRADGAMRGADFEYDGPKRGAWWDWKPTKSALEYLFLIGELMITNRVKFQRVYDLRERVLPDWVDQTAVTVDEANRYDVEQAVRKLGICEPLQAAQYAYMGLTTARAALKKLLADGILLEVAGELTTGDTRTLIIHRDRTADLQRALDGELKSQHTTFLSPFDSLFWARGRDEAFWNFDHKLEFYKPAADRIYGYFSMPILHHDRLVGRFDPKLDRKTGTLYLRALHLEPGIEPDEHLVTDVAAALRDFMAFHSATELVIEPRGHADFRSKLLAQF